MITIIVKGSVEQAELAAVAADLTTFSVQACPNSLNLSRVECGHADIERVVEWFNRREAFVPGAGYPPGEALFYKEVS